MLTLEENNVRNDQEVSGGVRTHQLPVCSNDNILVEIVNIIKKN
jgi:hypothetical protein